MKTTPRIKKNKKHRRVLQKGEKKKKKSSYALSRVRTSASVGRAGIAPFLVVVMAPHAFANLSTDLNLGSSCTQDIYFYVATEIIEIMINIYYQRWPYNYSKLRNGRSTLLTSSMDWSSTTLQSRAPTNESPAPVVSTVFTWKASTAPWKFYVYAKKQKQKNYG